MPESIAAPALEVPFQVAAAVDNLSHFCGDELPVRRLQAGVKFGNAIISDFKRHVNSSYSRLCFHAKVHTFTTGKLVSILIYLLCDQDSICHMRYFSIGI